MIIFPDGTDLCDLQDWNDWRGSREDAEAWQTLKDEVETLKAQAQAHEQNSTHPL